MRAYRSRRREIGSAMQNDPLTHGLWERTAPPAPPTAPLAGDVKADVAVVGCGYTGLSAALHLAEAGAKVVALEAVEVGFGGAGRNVGLVNAGMWVLPSEITEGARRPTTASARSTLLGRRRRPRCGRRSRSTPSTASPCATARCNARSARAGLAEIAERARAAGARAARRCERFSAAETARRGRIGAPTPARSSTCAPARSSRSPTPAALRARRSARARRSIRRARSARPSGRAAAGGSRPTRGSVTADWVVVATDAYGGVALAAGAARADPSCPISISPHGR